MPVVIDVSKMKGGEARKKSADAGKNKGKGKAKK